MSWDYTFMLKSGENIIWIDVHVPFKKMLELKNTSPQIITTPMDTSDGNHSMIESSEIAAIICKPRKE